MMPQWQTIFAKLVKKCWNMTNAGAQKQIKRFLRAASRSDRQAQKATRARFTHKRRGILGDHLAQANASYQATFDALESRGVGEGQ